MRIDYDNLPNPCPREAEDMPAIDLHTILFRRNYGMRATTDPYWRRLHRNFARQALRELRYLTNRPTKRRNVPTAYGQQEMNTDGWKSIRWCNPPIDYPGDDGGDHCGMQGSESDCRGF